MEVLNHTLAIDFGTSNSSVYLFKNHSEVLCDQTGSYLFPSYVEYSKNNIITGFAAKRNIGKSGKYVVSCVKRLIGLTYEEYELLDEKNIFGCEVVRGDDGFPYFVVSSDRKLVSCVDVAAELFKEMKSRADTYCDPRRFDSVYLTVPADYKPNQCDAICKAAEKAGLIVKKMIAEPSAAALSYLLDCKDQIGSQEKILVYDFGGGTFDASLLTYSPTKGINILGEEGNHCLGGNDVDLAIVRYVMKIAEKETNAVLIPPSNRAFKKFSLLKELCEEAKLSLFSSPSTDICLDEINPDFESFPLLPSSLDYCIEDVVNETITCVKKVIHDNHLSPGNIRHVFLVGGSSKLRLVRSILSKFFGENCDFPAIDPQHCVSLGAMKLLIQDSSNKNQNSQNQNLITSLTASYGIEISANEILILLRKGSVVPLTSHCYTFKTSYDYQNVVSMKIFQYSKTISSRENFTIVNKSECHELYSLDFSLQKQLPAGSYYIDIEFSFDIGGVLTVYCYEHSSHQLLYTCNYNPIYGSY